MNQMIKLLSAIEKDREISLLEASNMLDKNYGDHRDFYPLTFLIKNGYVDEQFLRERTPDDLKEQVLSRELFECSKGGMVANYGIKTITSTSTQPLNKQIFALSAKGKTYLDEYKSKKSDNIFTIIVSVSIAIISSFLTALFTKIVSS